MIAVGFLLAWLLAAAAFANPLPTPGQAEFDRLIPAMAEQPTEQQKEDFSRFFNVYGIRAVSGWNLRVIRKHAATFAPLMVEALDPCSRLPVWDGNAEFLMREAPPELRPRILEAVRQWLVPRD